MDFSRLVAFVNGMEYAMCSLENFKSMIVFDNEESETLATSKREFAESIIEKAMDFLQVDINQTIIEAVDEEESLEMVTSERKMTVKEFLSIPCWNKNTLVKIGQYASPDNSWLLIESDSIEALLDDTDNAELLEKSIEWVIPDYDIEFLGYDEDDNVEDITPYLEIVVK